MEFTFSSRALSCLVLPLESLELRLMLVLKGLGLVEEQGHYLIVVHTLHGVVRPMINGIFPWRFPPMDNVLVAMS